MERNLQTSGWTAGDRLQIIAGPCAIEGEDMAFRIAESLVETCSALDLPLIFKGSYRKANRSRIDSFKEAYGKDCDLQANASGDVSPAPVEENKATGVIETGGSASSAVADEKKHVAAWNLPSSHTLHAVLLSRAYWPLPQVWQLTLGCDDS